jgi:hypothetical protein
MSTVIKTLFGRCISRYARRRNNLPDRAKSRRDCRLRAKSAVSLADTAPEQARSDNNAAQIIDGQL